ncbi:MAG: hypothetical protein EOO56_03690 [Hymenobacter sp.]|nr:MAG: hypothetical protein EOO56_03690 [Hymenobacter sp.]
MKLSHLLLAAGLCSFSAASAQTTPTQTSPNTSNPSAVPSGTAPMPSNPNGAVSAGEVFTTGSPKDGSNDKRATKYKKNKRDASEKSKMKSGM